VLKNLAVRSLGFGKLPGTMLADRKGKQPVGFRAGRGGH
jgi:hypothetical protein